MTHSIQTIFKLNSIKTWRSKLSAKVSKNEMYQTSKNFPPLAESLINTAFVSDIYMTLSTRMMFTFNDTGFLFHAENEMENTINV